MVIQGIFLVNKVKDHYKKWYMNIVYRDVHCL